VIRPEIRQTVLANLPAGTPCVHAAGDIGALDPATADVFLEAFEEHADPLAVLRAVRAQLPHARLFALIANGAYLPALGAFFAGGTLAAGRPLVHAEIEPLFSAAGWQTQTIAPIVDATLPQPQAAPVEINAGPIIFQITDPAVLERVRSAAFFVVAGRR
jgi:hypothetical protein